MTQLQRAEGVFLCIVTFDVSFRNVVVWSLVFLLLHCGRIGWFVSFCAFQVFAELSAASQPPSKVQHFFYLLWLSDASIMALNLEFSSASKAAGLSNSNICDKDKTTAYQPQLQLSHFKKLCRNKTNETIFSIVKTRVSVSYSENIKDSVVKLRWHKILSLMPNNHSQVHFDAVYNQS